MRQSLRALKQRPAGTESAEVQIHRSTTDETAAVPSYNKLDELVRKKLNRQTSSVNYRFEQIQYWRKAYHKDQAFRIAVNKIAGKMHDGIRELLLDNNLPLRYETTTRNCKCPDYVKRHGGTYTDAVTREAICKHVYHRRKQAEAAKVRALANIDRLFGSLPKHAAGNPLIDDKEFFAWLEPAFLLCSINKKED